MALHTPAIVLKSVKYGEADLFLTMLTRKLGKISIFAKNARKINNPLMGSSQLFSYSNVTVQHMHQGYQLISSDLLQSHYNLTQDMKCIYYGYFFLELTDKVLEIQQKNVFLFDTLVDILDLLEKKTDPCLLKIIFQWKTLQAIGLRPEYQSCITCHKKFSDTDIYSFNLNEGGSQCLKCSNSRNTKQENLSIDLSVYDIMHYMEISPVKEIINALISPVLLQQFENLLDKYYAYHLSELVLNTHCLL